ncbi:MATE family efflux transporter [Leptospira biflexa]|jgi:putative MATE family efflux protein|uniref:MATE family efflux transporter n=1 Tax=Leptospira biflexa TaxID=172 RepID=UPI001083515C|nr:MATE family efflux transporter [Leptospira biflexa]TGM37374.1 MATE family efflux transporter [Leptospira biflexa]TGM40711.1 MATE family efflux transporter [Leptospira biflexa]TGM46915.1 MATE family efflux transporter [Leptospira biflexa]TGM50619.1 MATE family efflux transporter [Leptospira biflexa]TGM55893.1 MATE family efflux transporter [Leptospira biflexa]
MTRASLWDDLKKALAGSEADYTEVSLRKAIFLLSIPMILELVLESVFAVVDIYFVGKIGASAVATVGLTETYLFLLYSVAMGLSFSVTAIVARRIGEKEKDKAAIAAIQSIWIAIISSIPFAIAGIFYSKELLTLMGADEWVLNEGFHYMQWMLGGNLVIVLLFLINAVFRGAGDAAISMRVLWIANGFNIILDPIFIFGWGPIPAFGITGAAIATNIGRGIGVLFQLWLLFQGGKHIKILVSHLKIEWETISGILITSLGGIGQMVVGMTSWIFIMRILSEFGSQTVAGATIALRTMMFTLMPSWGMSNAVATLVGQNLGAGKPDRAEQSVWYTGFCNMGYLIIVSIIYYFFSENIIGIFTDDPLVIKIGSEWLRIVSYSYFIYAWWMAASQAFNGAGDTMTPTKINVIFFWIIQIPLAYTLGKYLHFGYSGVFWAMMLSETSVGIYTLWLFTKGKWKEIKV